MNRFLLRFGGCLLAVLLYFLLSTHHQKSLQAQQRDYGIWRSAEMAERESYRKEGHAPSKSHHQQKPVSTNLFPKVEKSQMIAHDGSSDVLRLDETGLKREFIYRRKRATTKTGRTKGLQNTTLDLNNQIMQAIVDKYDYCHIKGMTDSCDVQRFCSCEDDCVIFGNCCLDADIRLKFTDYELVRSMAERMECVNGNTETRDTYKLVTSCAPEFVDTYLEEKCVNINNTDVLSATPVYDKKLKISFRNIYCARCNLVSFSNLLFWEIGLNRCDFMTYNEMDGLTDFINQQLNVPKTFCYLFANPRSNFRVEWCFIQYVDEYVCDGYDLPNNSNFLTELSTQLSVSVTDSRTSSSATSSSSMPQLNLTPAITPTETHASLRQVCMAYKNVLEMQRSYVFRNSVCAWCKASIDSEKLCLVPRPGVSKVFPLSVLINFHSVLNIVREEKNKDCEENEILDSLTNICRRLTCTSRRIASYGKCMEAYSSVTTPRFSVLVYTSCEESIVSSMRDTIALYLRKSTNSMEISVLPPRTSRRDKFYVNGSNHAYCYESCVDLIINAQLTHHQVTTMTNFLENIFALIVVDGKANITRLNVNNNLSSCSSPIQTEQTSALPCPYITMNSSEYAILDEQLTSMSINLNNYSLLRTNDTYLICYDAYKQLLASFDKEGSVNSDKHKFIKSVLSLTLMSISLLALIISSLIYFIHPDLKTLPCRISLNMMLMLTGTCVLFLLSNLFESHSEICFVLAFLTQYVWLCVFLWSILFGYHTVITFSKLNLAREPNCNAREPCISLRLFVYGCIAYITPLLATACTVVLDRTGIFIMGYGVPTCFITNKKALLLTFGIPVMAMLFLNTAFHIIATVRLYRFSSGSSSPEGMRTSVLKTSVKLSVCLGLTWIFGIAATVTNVEVLWYIHIVLNSSHGIFMFVVLILWAKVVTSWCRRSCVSETVE